MPDPASGYPGTENDMEMVAKQGLYDPRNEHDACGVGFVVNIKGRKSHDLIRQGLKILVNLDHRGAVGADPLVGDGAGCLIQMPDRLLHDWADKAGKRLPQARPLRRRHVLPAAGRHAPASMREQHFAEVVTGEGQTLRRLARRADRPRPASARRVIETMPVIRQAIIAASPQHQGPGRVRAEDPRHPQADPEQRPHAWKTSGICPG